MALQQNIFVPQETADRIVIMAPGPSLSKEQVKMTQGIFTIAIGDAWRLNPLAEILYHSDAHWWKHYENVPEFYGCQRVSMEVVEQLPGRPNVKQILKSSQKAGHDVRSPYIVTGGNSGHQALNLAYHFKPKEIILLGFDMQDRPDGTHNVIGDHPPEVKRPTNFPMFIEAMGYIAQTLASEGINVYNCSTTTALTCFPKRDLKDVL